METGVISSMGLSTGGGSEGTVASSSGSYSGVCGAFAASNRRRRESKKRM